MGHPHGALLLDGMWRVLRRRSWSAGLPKLGLAVCDAFIAHGSEGVVRPLQVGIAGDPLPQAGTVYAPYCVEWVWFFCGEGSTRPARFNENSIRRQMTRSIPGGADHRQQWSGSSHSLPRDTLARLVGTISCLAVVARRCRLASPRQLRLDI